MNEVGRRLKSGEGQERRELEGVIYDEWRLSPKNFGMSAWRDGRTALSLKL